MNGENQRDESSRRGAASEASRDARTPAQVEERKEREPSRVETLFQRGPVPLGEALGRIGGPRPTPLTDPLEQEEEQRRKEIFAELMTKEEGEPEWPLRDKVMMFDLLDERRQQLYLESLDAEERRRILELTDQRRSSWMPRDLKGGDIDRDLKQFGFDFFQTDDAAFLPDPMAPVGPDYVVGPGDTLVIDLWGGVEGHYEVTVDRSGSLTLPRVGAVNLWGQTFAEARETLRRQVAKYFSNFEINVTMGSLRSIQVFLVGEVENPGTYTVSSMSTILNALTQAGGPSRNGSLRDVQLVRGGQTMAHVDFYDFFMAGDRKQDLRLRSGDTIHVPIASAQVGIAGDVRRPAIYELREGETLRHLLQMAGGLQSTAYLKKIQIERVLAHQGRKVIDLDLDTTGLDIDPFEFAMQDRDLVQVHSISPAKNRYVRLEGFVARPGFYQLHEGMRLSELLVRYDNLLPYYYPGAAEILRLTPPLYTPEKMTVNLARALAGDPQDNIELRAHDEVRIFSREEMEDTASVRISGAVREAGTFRYFDEMRVRDLVIEGGNVARGAFLQEAELTRFEPAPEGMRSSRQTINLQAALEGDPKHNLLLHPDDHLFVRSIPEFAEKPVVELQGEVRFPGQYPIAKGETLASLIERAGGFTEGAYLRGATFTREEVRETQRERFDALILEQEQEILRASSDIASGALSAEEIKSAETLLNARQQMVEKLKNLPVTGRMVVNLAPLDTLRGSAADIELKDGDTLIIPANPKTVSVLGQVYNQTTLAFAPGKTVSYYMNKVGGTRKNADSDEMYIVRADGTVYSKQQAGAGLGWDRENFRWVLGGFNNTQIYPGDTILVPEKYERTDIMREVKDLTQIIYQMALGAAAVASF
ncbi:SLBB domain-containing protein [Geoalkalibacter subterraneus]|uniref:SLBB domain-containing protein n=1 Tax=Geoalkalibacter subterraneus TaxID=483547 RepID=UPI00130D690E|nr:SLBB domain-containing protein [Geoalkalibacter subterraneus]